MLTTTWLPIKGGPLDQIPIAADQLRALVARLWDTADDPVILELCRLRIALLVDVPADPAFRSPHPLDNRLASALSAWPDDPRFTDAQRSALGFAEQYVLDAHGVTDSQIARLRDHFSPAQLATVTTGIAVFDALARAGAVLAGDPRSSTHLA